MRELNEPEWGVESHNAYTRLKFVVPHSKFGSIVIRLSRDEAIELAWTIAEQAFRAVPDKDAR